MLINEREKCSLQIEGDKRCSGIFQKEEFKRREEQKVLAGIKIEDTYHEVFEEEEDSINDFEFLFGIDEELEPPILEGQVKR